MDVGYRWSPREERHVDCPGNLDDGIAPVFGVGRGPAFC